MLTYKSAQDWLLLCIRGTGDNFRAFRHNQMWVAFGHSAFLWHLLSIDLEGGVSSPLIFVYVRPFGIS